MGKLDFYIRLLKYKIFLYMRVKDYYGLLKMKFDSSVYNGLKLNFG